MCGIAGYWGTFEPELLERMARIQAHRGPDGAGTWHEAALGVGLAHRRLSIIDLTEAGRQPMSDDATGNVIVFNGEIYNYRELRRDLEARGVGFQSHSDTEVLLKLYQREGMELLQRLNGIFAFALWDARQRQLFVARDHFGIKPLYYVSSPQGFLFASEVKALLQHPGVRKSLDPTALLHYLTYLWCPAPLTALEGVHKLEPGQALLLREGRISRQWYYYDIPYSPEVPDISEADAIEGLRHHLRQAVQRQLVSDVPVGAFLSGGLDSSAVVTLAAQALPSRSLPCFTIATRGQELEKEGFATDWPYAQKVARHLQVPLSAIPVGPELAQQLELMLYHLDEPQADMAPLNVLMICKLAREHGIKVLLSGAGGDDILSGYPRHYALGLERCWSWVPRALRAGMQGLSQGLPQQVPACRRISTLLRYAPLPPEERLVSYFFRSDPHLAMELLHPDLRQVLSRQPVPSPLLRSLERLPPGLEPLDRMLYLEGKHFLADHNLNYTDKLSMAAGVEARVPLLDLDLVRFAVRLPPRFKQRGATGKWIFKKAMESLLPNEVIHRPKTGFGVPLRRWMRHELKPFVEEWLSPESLRRRGIFDPQRVARLVADNGAGRIDGANTLFSLICIEGWCRIFLDATPQPK